MLIGDTPGFIAVAMANPRNKATTWAPRKTSLWSRLLCQACGSPFGNVIGIQSLICPQALLIRCEVDTECNLSTAGRPGKVSWGPVKAVMHRRAGTRINIEEKDIGVTGTDKPTALGAIVKLGDDPWERLYIRLPSRSLALRCDILVDNGVHNLPTAGREHPLPKRAGVREQYTFCFTAINADPVDRRAVILARRDEVKPFATGRPNMPRCARRGIRPLTDSVDIAGCRSPDMDLLDVLVGCDIDRLDSKRNPLTTGSHSGIRGGLET